MADVAGNKGKEVRRKGKTVLSLLGAMSVTLGVGSNPERARDSTPGEGTAGVVVLPAGPCSSQPHINE